MAKRPSFQFYPSDWIIDPSVATLDYYDMGVLMKLLCFASQTGGELRLHIGGEPLSVSELAISLGLEKNKCATVLATLLRHGCLKQSEDGCYYNARMVRDSIAEKAYTESKKRAAKVGNDIRWGEKVANASQANRKPVAEGIANASQEASQTHRLSSSSSSSNINNINKNAYAREEEIPPGMPRSETEAIELCSGTGVPDDFVILAYNRSARENFTSSVLKKGTGEYVEIPIKSWKHHVKSYFINTKNKEEREKRQNHKTPREAQPYMYDNKMKLPQL
jgi:hypothetical protein